MESIPEKVEEKGFELFRATYDFYLTLAEIFSV